MSFQHDGPTAYDIQRNAVAESKKDASQAAIGMKGVEEMCGSIPWEEIFFWAPFRNEEA